MLQALTNGVVLGALFAVLAVGLTLVYGVMDVPNFAHAGVITVGAYLIFTMQQGLGLPLWVAALVGVLGAGLLSVATDLVAYRFVRDRPLAAPAVALGLLLILDNSALQIWGFQHKSMDVPYASTTVYLGFATISAVDLAVVVIAVVSLGALSVLLRRTGIGRAIRAVSQDREAAAVLGLRLQRQYVVAFFISGVLAGLAALAYAPTFDISPYMADGLILNAFVVVILGGLGSISGAMVGGLVLGIVESVGAVYVSASYQTAFGFLVLLLVLVLRPSGLFSTTGRRVA